MKSVKTTVRLSQRSSELIEVVATCYEQPSETVERALIMLKQMKDRGDKLSAQFRDENIAFKEEQ